MGQNRLCSDFIQTGLDAYCGSQGRLRPKADSGGQPGTDKD